MKRLMKDLSGTFAPRKHCLEYDQLTQISSDAIAKLREAIHAGANSFIKNRAISRLMVAELGVDRHITSCEFCQQDGRFSSESELYEGVS